MYLRDLPAEPGKLLADTSYHPLVDLDDVLKASLERAGSGAEPKERRVCIRSAKHVSQAPLPFVETVIAKTPSQRSAAAELVRRRYAWRGYDVCAEDSDIFPDETRAPYYLTLLANTPAKTVGTITLGIDSVAGLFVDQSNKTEIDAIRADGRRVCEVIRLAVDEGSDSKSVLASLFASVITLCQNVYHLTDLLAEVNPRHVAFYRRVIGFAVAGTEKVCARVGAPSVLLLLELQADGLLERVSTLSRQV